MQSSLVSQCLLLKHFSTVILEAKCF